MAIIVPGYVVEATGLHVPDAYVTLVRAELSQNGARGIGLLHVYTGKEAYDGDGSPVDHFSIIAELRGRKTVWEQLYDWLAAHPLGAIDNSDADLVDPEDELLPLDDETVTGVGLEVAEPAVLNRRAEIEAIERENAARAEVRAFNKRERERRASQRAMMAEATKA